LAAVHVIEKTDKEGRRYYEWTERKRNEIWDLFYYAHAMLYILREYLSDRFIDLEEAMRDKQRSKAKPAPSTANRPQRAVIDLKEIEV